MGELYGKVVSLGIAPDYFLDRMSFDEVAIFLKAHNDKKKEEWEKERWTWFYILLSKDAGIKKPTDIMKFDWEKKPKKEGKKLTRDEIRKKEEKAKRWLGKKKYR